MITNQYNMAAGKNYSYQYIAGGAAPGFNAGTSATFTPAFGHFWLERITGSPPTDIRYSIRTQTGVTFNPDGSISVPSGQTVTITATSASSENVLVKLIEF